MIDAEQQTEEQIEMTPSEKYYQNHLSRMREYNAKNRDKVNERNRARYKKIVSDERQYKAYLEKKKEDYRKIKADEEKYEKYLEKKRQEYQKRKLRNQENQENTNDADNTE